MTLEFNLAVVLIFCARCTDVSMATMRMLLLVKGQRFKAACIGFVEISLYLLSLKYVLDAGLNSPLSFIAYALGFSTGNYIGSFLEEKLLKGHLIVEIIIEDTEAGRMLADVLRSKGFGTTVLEGEGRDGPRLILKVICERKDRILVAEEGKKAGGFVFMADIRNVWGGYFTKKK
ncbi:MAG: DUF5698 domain-containing protein [Aminobacterium sp.]|jgi:uncharacterized protein YebE (UPF0316 family)|uniref:DUF5698 domain-containing protein n=1 Tax=bioreactor metagenome TaxID=1076179 RepID=A0A645BAS8_9ZZZZ|nr:MULTISPECIES: DUF5698 domain-containing protein [unclassified Aminobacterium]MDD2206250.1 DUF5698 domain-containing protein [Aminobacterium sp.]MDD3425803.1 DUF5698 domain-containing protein [Aminobacterium sp.]MDD3707555.1 DUF5698 domain-containing protein [Aminobacterium sp.]MDD4229307.1 DUF5698 domain-containing protein [Aminobacterium sp.]MDD4552189.1 DUF5698 domain-containing protein [Aminobacterium sp.]